MVLSMRVESLSIQSLDIPFKLAFSHASAERNRTQSVLVTAKSADGLLGFGEGCPREYVTGESLESAMKFFTDHRQTVSELRNLNGIHEWVNTNRETIDANPAAWCAIELALLDLLGKNTQQSLETLLGQPTLNGVFQYSAILGTDDLQVFQKLVRTYLDMGFTDFKVKLTGDLPRDRDKIDVLKAHINNSHRIRFDANNCWTDVRAASEYLASIDCPFWAVEEPLVKDDYHGLVQLAEDLGKKIILDESFQHLGQLVELQETIEHWVVNLRVSKMGGLLRSLELVKAFRNIGIPIIIGAQVGETSLLTRAALTIANSARDILTAQEGAYGTHLLEYDLCDPPLMFERGGRLNTDTLPLRDDFGCGADLSL